MKTPIAWLREYVDLPGDAAAIIATLASLGFPVDGIEHRPALSGIVVGRIATVERVPKADRLQVCTIDVGAAQPLTIATAAQNVAAGQTIPVATIGAQLATVKIARRKMMGIESEGMLVSAEEIGLPGEWFEDGILQLEAELPPGTDFIAHFRLNEPVLDVDVTSNRADALSMVGLARELAATCGNALRLPPADAAASGESSSDVSVEIASPDCTRFIAQRISNLTVKTAPFLMRLRLALAGQRPINNIVDVSNYVMLETGQPLHFYDFEKLAGRKLIVRDPQPAEHLVTLDGEDRELPPSALVIADEKDAQALAGLRGGAASEVRAATREIVIESATFRGARIRRMSVALGLRTEGSSRQEKSLPPASAELGAARAAYLLAAEGATVRAPLRAGPEPIASPAIELSAGEIRRILGCTIEPAEVERSLRALGFSVERLGNGVASYRVVVPPWRNDVAIPADLVEEIARIVGYDAIEPSEPVIVAGTLSSESYRTERRVAEQLAALGYREIVRLSLEPASIADRYARAGTAYAARALEIVNPLSEDQRYVRTSLVPGFLATAERERERPLDLFEIGHVAYADTGADGAPPIERMLAGWCSFGKSDDADASGAAWRDDGFFEFKGRSTALLRRLCGRDPHVAARHAAEFHPGKSAVLLIDGAEVAAIGAIDPRLLAAFDVPGPAYFGVIDLAVLPGYRVPTYRAPSRFPGIARDLALVVHPGIAAAEISEAIREASNAPARDIHVFDEYRGPQVGEGKKSLAIRVLFQRDDATMTDREADEAIARVLAALKAKVGAEIRS